MNAYKRRPQHVSIDEKTTRDVNELEPGDEIKSWTFKRRGYVVSVANGTVMYQLENNIYGMDLDTLEAYLNRRSAVIIKG